MNKIIDSWIDVLGLERERELSLIGRYNMYQFNYRTSVDDHAKRVTGMYLEVWPIFRHLGYLFSKGYVLARTHDDLEIDPNLLDIQAGHKAVMSEQAISEVNLKEQLAIDYVVERFGNKIGPYEYHSLLLEAKERQTPEAQLIKLLDKYDAYCEAIHELLAGNIDVTINKSNEYGKPAPVPFEYYPDLVSKIANESEILAKIFCQAESPFLGPIDLIDFRLIVQHGLPHTAKSSRQPKGIPVYDAWIQMIFKYAITEPTWLWTPNCREFTNCRP